MAPLPKKKHSKKRKAGRSAHHFLKPMAITTCSQCRSVRLPHRVCPSCGYYNGREVVSTDSAA